MVAASFIVLAILLFKVRGARNQEFEGIWEKGFERSGFHNNAACWTLPYWLESSSELSARLRELGNPESLPRYRTAA